MGDRIGPKVAIAVFLSVALMTLLAGTAPAAPGGVGNSPADRTNPLTPRASDPFRIGESDEGGVYQETVFISGPTYIDPITGGWFYGDLGRLMALQSPDAIPTPDISPSGNSGGTPQNNTATVDLIANGLGPTTIVAISMPSAPRRAPEPRSAALLCAALFGLALMRHRRG